MKLYIGTKIILAKPMTRGDYNNLRHWQTPSDENPSDNGYLVEYQDGGKPNHKDFSGYISWSPEAVFEGSYRPSEDMGFGEALKLLKAGYRVHRAGWNGKGMFVFLVSGSTFSVNRHPLLGIYPEGTRVDYRSHIDMKAADGSVVPWVASQTDLLAEDWAAIK